MQFPAGRPEGLPDVEQMLRSLKPYDDKGRSNLTLLADAMVRSEERRTATLEGVKALYMNSESGTEEKATAAIDFLCAIKRADEMHREATVAAMCKLVEAITEGEVTREALTKMAAKARFMQDPEQATRNLSHSREFREYAQRFMEDDGTMNLMISGNGHGLYVCGLEDKDDLSSVDLEGGLYFEFDGTCLGNEPPQAWLDGGFDPEDAFEGNPMFDQCRGITHPESEVSGEPTIEGIDLSMTFDPDEHGRKRDFDGGFE